MPRTPHPYIDGRFEHQLEMVRPSREGADVPALPVGYTLRAFRHGDESAYDDLFRLAWPDEGTLSHTRAHTLPGGFVVVECAATTELVASCAAFAPHNAEHPSDGGLGWLVVDPAHGRRGLGTIVAATVTNRSLDEGYAMPWLSTEDDRLQALRIYLGMGWRPRLYIEGMEVRWRAIFQSLGFAFSLNDCTQ